MKRSHLSNKILSVIIPCYNCNDFINTTLKSVTENDYGNIEIILIDDVGDEDFRPIIDEKYKKYIKIIKNYKNSGPGYSRVKGMETAKGKYILFLDSDDILSRSSISRRISMMEKYNLDFIRGGLSYYKGNRFYKGPFNEKNVIEDDINKNSKDFEILWAPGCYIIKKETLMRTNDYKRSMDYRIGEDQILISALLKNTNKYSIIEDVVYYYRENEDSLMKSEWSTKKLYDFVFFQQFMFQNIFEMPKLYNLQKKIRFCGKYFIERLNLIINLDDCNEKEEMINELKRLYSDEYRKSKIELLFNISTIKTIRKTWRKIYEI